MLYNRNNAPVRDELRSWHAKGSFWSGEVLGFLISASLLTILAIVERAKKARGQ